MSLLIESQERIVQAPESLISAEAKKELLTILAGLSLRVIRDRDLARKLVTEIRLMGDNYFFDLIREEGEAIGLARGRREGQREGQREGHREGQTAEARKAILLVLRKRFGRVAAGIRKRLAAVEAINDLEALLGEAVTVPTIQAFAKRLSQPGSGSG